MTLIILEDETMECLRIIGVQVQQPAVPPIRVPHVLFVFRHPIDIPALRSARVIIAVAGMEGALPGVLAGLTPAPVLAVPTSVGYGIGTGGVAALSTMLCTCVPGVAVLNIDNGFGAAAFAAKLTLGRPERR